MKRKGVLLSVVAILFMAFVTSALAAESILDKVKSRGSEDWGSNNSSTNGIY